MALTRPTASANTLHSASGEGAHAILGAGTRVRGRVTGQGDLTVLGHLEGEIRLQGELFIASGGHVVSDVEASALRVAGSLEGNINVTGDVSILAGASVTGDVRGARSISLEEGAELDGRLDSDFALPAELEPQGGSRSSRDSGGPAARR